MNRFRIALVVAAAGLLQGGSPVAADCSADPRDDYLSAARSAPEDAPIIRAFFGRVVDAVGPDREPEYVVRVEEPIAGKAGPRVLTFGQAECVDYRLVVGQHYLFAVTDDPDFQHSMVIELDHPAWRSVVWKTYGSTLDGRPVPTEPARLLAFLRRHLGSLPDTSAMAPHPDRPVSPAWLLVPGLLGAAAWMARGTRRSRSGG